MMQMANSFDFEGFSTSFCDLAGEGDVRCDVLAHSILGRDVPVLTLGTGQKAVVYVGGVCGTEWILAKVLLGLVRDFCARSQKGSKAFDVNLSYLAAERRIIVVPMLNPDGIAYATDGVGEDNPLFERVMKMNGSADFSTWQANARGTDLAFNFDAGFEAHRARAGLLNGAPVGYGGEHPESEPESAALGRLLRFLGDELLGLVEFRLGAGEIRCNCRDKLTAKTMSAGRILARATGYRLADLENAVPEGSVCDWCIEKLSRPAYRVECDARKFAPERVGACLTETLARTFYTFPFMV